MKLNKIFTFLKENSILIDIKTALLPVIEKERKELKPKLEVFIKDKTPIIKTVFIDYLLTKVSLPIYLRPFKPIVRKVLDKNIDKLADFLTKNL